ncbi:MAG: glycoside hydrolase family 3 C-terminal domain-containing protein, partial [Firmicutes bacterium]|nr:glycoside hydrolase family 3 C-terminal domain-containing protein [Bacillota bacterium]
IALTGGNALLQAWYPGQAGGTALANILFGRVSPSGRLPVTFYKDVADLPDFENYDMKNRTYRYFEGEALYPFGYGLSYSRFALSGASYRDGAVTVTVMNTGAYDADEVVQVYVKDHTNAFAVRNHSLCAFKRVALAAGASQTVTLPIGKAAFASIDLDGKPVQGKRFTLYVGGSQPDAVSVRLTGQKPLELSVEI